MMGLLQRIKSLFKIARLVSSDDSGAFQQGVFYYMGSSPKGQIFIPYGDLMRPPENAQMAVFAQNGNESNQIAFASDPKNRTVKDLQQGEKGIANYITGDYFLLTAEDGAKLVTSKFTVNVGDTTVTIEDGTVTVDNADIIDRNGVNLTTHNHSQGNDSDGDAEVDTNGPQNP